VFDEHGVDDLDDSLAVSLGEAFEGEEAAIES
jgi:hypothetical protein